MNVTEEKKRSVPPAGEDRLIVQVKAGSSEAFAALAHRYIPLIKKLVGAAGVPPSERDDLTQEGLIGLLRAVRSYDNESSSFSTYASLCIKHSIISALRKYSRVSCVYLSDSPLGLAPQVRRVPKRIWWTKKTQKRCTIRFRPYCPRWRGGFWRCTFRVRPIK